MLEKLKYILIISLLLLSGCSVNNNEGMDRPFEVELIVSREFGSEILFEKTVLVEAGETVLDILEKNLEVEASTGGFVKAINGLSSSIESESGKDWFYYVNGIASNCSSKAYHLKKGDKLLWDYHQWNGNSFIPAIIGAYPEPFVNGFKGMTKGTRIYYSEGNKNEALKIKQSLANLKAQNIIEEPLPEKIKVAAGYPCILVGEYANLIKNKSVTALLSDGESRGMPVRFGKGEISLLNCAGSVEDVCDSKTGIVFAIANSLGDTAPVWVVTSLEHKGIEALTDLIFSKPESIEGYYGIAYKGKLQRLPCVRSIGGKQ
ncbi:MAG: DUF4430 domain-containing protein [Deltaproteobacteria bacterium]